MYSIFYKMKPSNFVKIYFYYFQYLLIYYIQITKLPFYFTLKIVRTEDCGPGYVYLYQSEFLLLITPEV